MYYRRWILYISLVTRNRNVSLSGTRLSTCPRRWTDSKSFSSYYCRVKVPTVLLIYVLVLLRPTSESPESLSRLKTRRTSCQKERRINFSDQGSMTLSGTMNPFNLAGVQSENRTRRRSIKPKTRVEVGRPERKQKYWTERKITEVGIGTGPRFTDSRTEAGGITGVWLKGNRTRKNTVGSLQSPFYGVIEGSEGARVISIRHRETTVGRG